MRSCSAVTIAAALTLAAGAKATDTPSWTATVPQPGAPLAGFSLLPETDRKHMLLYYGEEAYGNYNHAAMIDYSNGTFLALWKNGPLNEDKDGQRILYSMSTDGETWSKTDGKNVMFPSLSTKDQESAMFVGPPIKINGRWYVGGSPGVPTDAAAAAQYCLWPDPVTPRNCGPPAYTQQSNTLIMRQVLGLNQLGPMFWAADEGPKGWKKATEQYGVKTLDEMDAVTQKDVATLNAQETGVPCNFKSGTMKCEACVGGCQLWDDAVIPVPPPPPAPLNVRNEKGNNGHLGKKIQQMIGNERSHYVVPGTNTSAAGYPDVILYRSGEAGYMFAGMRNGPKQSDWISPPVLTNIPNDESNLNTGPLPDGRVYLLNNPALMPKNDSRHLLDPENLETLRFRDPITVATSMDGYIFNKAVAVISCTALPNSTCTPRVQGGGKNPGPSYPQGLPIVDPAPAKLHGFYFINSNNKEDIWVTKVPYSAF